MATMGTEWKYDKEQIAQALNKTKGRITHACRELNVGYRLLKKVIDKEPDLAELLENLRADFENTILDMAENCVAIAMSRQLEQPKSALTSAMYTLNSKGLERGWTNTLSDAPPNDKNIELEKRAIELEYKNQKLQIELDALKPKTNPELL